MLSLRDRLVTAEVESPLLHRPYTRQQTGQFQFGIDRTINTRIADLDGNFGAIVQYPIVDLAQRCSRHRWRERTEHFMNRLAKAFLDDRPDVVQIDRFDTLDQIAKVAATLRAARLTLTS
jgi:hypothetical protein